MTALEIATTAGTEVTEKTLRRSLRRALVFLHGATEPSIRAQLALGGWTDEDAHQGQSLVALVQRLNDTGSQPRAKAFDIAMRTCEACQSTLMVRARALLAMTHPEQASFLFHDHRSGRKGVAVLNVMTLLARTEGLDKDPERKATREQDHAALAVLVRAGLTKEVRRSLEQAVGAVQRASHSSADAPVATPEQRIEALRRVYVWVTTWGEVARTVVTRRDQRIRLGIAARRAAKDPIPSAPSV